MLTMSEVFLNELVTRVRPLAAAHSPVHSTIDVQVLRDDRSLDRFEFHQLIHECLSACLRHRADLGLRRLDQVCLRAGAVQKRLRVHRLVDPPHRGIGCTGIGEVRLPTTTNRRHHLSATRNVATFSPARTAVSGSLVTKHCCDNSGLFWKLPIPPRYGAVFTLIGAYFFVLIDWRRLPFFRRELADAEISDDNIREICGVWSGKACGE